MIQLKDNRVNILFAVIAFGMFIHFIQNFIQMSNQPMYFIASVVVPLIFLIMSTLFIRESMYYLLIPLIAYFSERVFVLLNLGRYFIYDYNSFFLSATDNLNVYLNLIRNSLGIIVALMVILAITNKSLKLWQRSHQWVMILLVIQLLQLLTMTGFRSELFEILLQTPLFLYFGLTVFFITHPKYYLIAFDAQSGAGMSYGSMMSHPGTLSHQNNLSQPGVSSSSNSGQAQAKPINRPVVPTSRICPQCAANNKAEAQSCHQCGSSLNGSVFKNSTPTLQSTPPASKPYSESIVVINCPECGQSNQNTTYCLNCGHSLTKGNVS